MLVLIPSCSSCLDLVPAEFVRETATVTTTSAKTTEVLMLVPVVDDWLGF